METSSPAWHPTVVASAVALVFLACGRPGPLLEPVPHPALDPIDAAARDQIRQAIQQLDDVTADGRAADRAVAYGELGRIYQAYDFDEAARVAFANAVSLEPDTFRWRYYLGSLELDEGRTEAGRRQLERALELRPSDGPTLRRLGRAALDEAEFGRAERLYRAAAEAEPTCAAAHFGIGLAALGAGRTSEAIPAFKHALELDPAASQIHRPLAMAYRSLGDDAAARRHLAEAGTTVPFCADPLQAEVRALASGASALFERAALAEVEGRTETAIELARRAIASDDTHAAAHRLLGSLLTQQGKTEAAIESLRRSAALEPEDRRTWILLGRAYRAAGELEASTTTLERAVELDPDHARAHAELAWTSIERSNWPSARAQLERALELDPDDAELAVQHARALAATGETTAARQRLEAILERRPDAALARVALGALSLDDGDLDVAEEELTRALAGEGSSDTYALAHFHLARIRATRADDDLARRHLDTALELVPGFVEARLARADLALASGRFTEAARRFEAVAEERPDLVAAHTGSALALLESGRHLEARQRLETAWRDHPEPLAVGHLLARVLATAPAPRVRNASRAVELATTLFERQPDLAHGETVAMALAAAGRFDEAIAWQRRLVVEARGGGAPAETVTRLESRLSGYERGAVPRSAWRE